MLRSVRLFICPSVPFARRRYMAAQYAHIELGASFRRAIPRFILSCRPISRQRKTLQTKAGIPRDRHGHRHRHGHPRRLPREDRREDVGVSGDFPVQLATSRTHDDPRRLIRRLVRHARFYSRGCPVGMRACTRVNVTVHDKLPCTRLQNYTINASLMSVSVSVSVPWNSSYNARAYVCL